MVREFVELKIDEYDKHVVLQVLSKMKQIFDRLHGELYHKV